MTIENWIQGKVGFTLTDFNISAILVDRDVTPEADASTISVRIRELCWADAITVYITFASKGSSSQADGSSSETTPSEYTSYKNEAKDMAIYLYGKWGEEVPVALSNLVKDASYLWGANGFQ